MRKALSAWMLAAGLLLAAASSASASTLGLDVTSNTTVFAPNFSLNAGWQFSVNAPITVDGLGFFDVLGRQLVSSPEVGLWNSNGVLLAQTTVTNGSTRVSSRSSEGNWLFEDINPIVLQPGTYVAGAFYAVRSGFFGDLAMGNAAITTAPEITFLASRTSAAASFGEPGVFGQLQPGMFGPDIRIATVPEPASLLLLGSGLVALAIPRRTFQK